VQELRFDTFSLFDQGNVGSNAEDDVDGILFQTVFAVLARHAGSLRRLACAHPDSPPRLAEDVDATLAAFSSQLASCSQLEELDLNGKCAVPVEGCMRFTQQLTALTTLVFNSCDSYGYPAQPALDVDASCHLPCVSGAVTARMAFP
jgi:hypothetical protein